MKEFKIMGVYSPKDTSIAGRGLEILECNELQEMILTKVSKSGKSKDFPIRSMICRANLDTEVFQGRYILIDSKFKRLRKLEQTALILRENVLESYRNNPDRVDSDPRVVAFTSEIDKVMANAEVMSVINPRAAARGFIKAEKFSVGSTKKAVVKSGQYKASKKAKRTAASLLDSLREVSDFQELEELLENTPEDILEEAAAEIFDAAMAASPSTEEAATAAASTAKEPVQTVVEATATVKDEQKAAKTKKQSAPKGTPAPAV